MTFTVLCVKMKRWPSLEGRLPSPQTLAVPSHAIPSAATLQTPVGCRSAHEGDLVGQSESRVQVAALGLQLTVFRREANTLCNERTRERRSRHLDGSTFR